VSSVPSGLLITIAVLLVVSASFLAATEAALGRVTRPQTARLVADRRRGSVALQAVVADPARVTNVSIFLRVTAESAAAVCVTLVLAAAIDSGWVAVLLVSAAVMAAVSFVLVGVSPRTLGSQHAETVGLLAAGPLRAAARLLGPVAQGFVVLGNAVTPGRGFREGPFASEGELREMVDLASESQVIEAGERRMIHSVFELGDTIVREVMVPRTDVLTIEVHSTLHDAMTLFLRSGFSRIPVVGESVDDVRGVLYLKDVARRMHTYPDQARTQTAEYVARQAVFVPESKPVDALLREMQRDSTHVAVVVDEYGGTAGLVTIEDVLEEIVGEIADEYDREMPGVERVEEDTYRLSARLPIDDLAEVFGVEVDDDEVDSVGGLLAKALGKVPIPGDEVVVGGLVLVAERREGRRNRVATVLARRDPATAPAERHG
jgi:CBS domain containing-hemolysin-like protein